MSSDPNDSVKNASADGVDEGKFGQAGLLNPDRSNSRSASGPSVSQLRGSRASMSAPTKERIFNPHAENPSRIPTAGGVSVGSKQYEQRRASRVSAGDIAAATSPPQSPEPVPEEEIPAESSKDGAANGTAEPPAASAPTQAPAVAVPEHDPDSVAPDAHPPASESAPVAPAEEQSTTTTTDQSTTDKAKETVKEKLPSAVGGNSSSPSSPTKERRGSRLLGKLGLGSKK